VDAWLKCSDFVRASGLTRPVVERLARQGRITTRQVAGRTMYAAADVERCSTRTLIGEVDEDMFDPKPRDPGEEFLHEISRLRR
jgi:hypothetical protein